jgi:hypothetical protein
MIIVLSNIIIINHTTTRKCIKHRNYAQKKTTEILLATICNIYIYIYTRYNRTEREQRSELIRYNYTLFYIIRQNFT